MKKPISFLFALLLSALMNAQTAIPGNFYGLNGWLPDYVGGLGSPGPGLSVPQPTNTGGSLYTYTNSAFTDLNARMMRYGGTNADINNPTISQLTTFVNKCQAAKMTPVIQIPLAYIGYMYPGFSFTNAVGTSSCASLVSSIVSTLSASPYNVTYYSIGNEPDRYAAAYGNSSFTISPGDLGYCIRAISDIIKGINPYAIVIGPDISSYSGSYINGVITGSVTTDITASNSKTPSSPFCDIIAYHTYPMSGPQGRLTVAGKPASSFAGDLANLRTRIALSPNANKIKIAVTELNINTQNAAANTYSNMGCNSFIGGQWMAEMYAYGLKGASGAPVAFMTPWCFQESYGNAGQFDLGLISGSVTTSPQYRSTYIHTKMMAEQFSSGTFFMATPNNTVNPLVKAWSASDCSRLAVMFINQDSSSAHTVMFSHGTSLPTGYSDVGMALNIVPTPNLADMTYTIAPKETRVLVFDVCGHLRKTYIYNETMNSSYSSYTTTSTTTTRFCQCFKTVASAFPNYGLRCAVSTETGTVHYNTYTLSANTRIKDSAYITGALTVPSGYTLTIDTAEVTFAGGAKIVVQSGGKLIITGSALHGCSDPGSAQWSGIQVSDANTTPQFTMTTSSLDGATIGVGVQQGYLPVITDNVFTNCGIGIKLNKTKGFTITGNEFSSVPVCIKTASTISTSASISENLFYQPDTTLIFKDDDHSQLSIGCNGFAEYTSYGIYATGGALQSQGSSGTGAGNFFSSASTYTNNQLYYTGSGMTYYCDPSNTFTLAGSSGGITLTATVTAASDDGSCDQIDNKLAAHGITKNGNQGTTAAGAIASSQGAGSANTASQLLDCIPNPASGRITFAYTLADRGKPAELWIRNLMGETVTKLTLPAASQSVETDLSAMGNGIYFYSLVIDGNIIASKKLVISK